MIINGILNKRLKFIIKKSGFVNLQTHLAYSLKSYFNTTFSVVTILFFASNTCITYTPLV